MKIRFIKRLMLLVLVYAALGLSAQPIAPTLYTPTNGSGFQVLGTNFTWNAVSGATYYKINICTDSTMTNMVFSQSNIVGTSVFAQNLAYNSTYFWTVQAGNNIGLGKASKVWSIKTMPDNPNAVNSHPRLLFTQSDIPRLQSWANNSNPIYKHMQTALATAITNYNTKFFPGGVPNPTWPDNGGITWSSYVTESYAEFFAFWSLVDPDPANRIVHAQRARNLLMYVIDQAYLGPSTGVPFRDPQFMAYDRSRVYGEACPLTVDWIYDAKDGTGNAILTADDKRKIRTVFMDWCNDQLTAYNHPTPIGVINDKKLGPNRWALNNYYSGHARNMTFMSLSMDAAEDTLIDPNLHFSALGNSLKSYLYNATGAWLYQQYAMYETPGIVAADYGIPANTPSLGLGSGGMSVEGSLYGECMAFVVEEILALKTAGWADENIIGKQAKLVTSEYWTRFMDGLIQDIAPFPKVPAQATYYGPIYQMAGYGDMLRSWITPEIMDVTGSLSILDMVLNQNKTRLDKARWYTRNVIQGGATALGNRITNIWAGSVASSGIFYFMSLDPAGSDPADPRPGMSLNFWDPSFHKVLTRTDWTNNCSWFNWQCHWASINHQSGDGNQFEFYRKGEWLIKERSGYCDDGIGYTSEFHNTLGLQNDVPSNLQFFETETSARGGQWTNGQNAGDPEVISSFDRKYFYATGDATKLYNRPNPWTPSANVVDIEYAVRSIFWLKPDMIVVYDRAKSKTADRFKRFFLQFTAAPVVSGKKVTVTTANGQKLYLSNLLPAASVLTGSVSVNANTIAQLEPTTHQLKIEDPSNPMSVRFLNVIQGADSNSVAINSQLVQSTAGNEFEGAIIANTAVLFKKTWSDTFKTTTYTLPGIMPSHLVSGLVPNTAYKISIKTIGVVNEFTITPGAGIRADSGGVLNVVVPISAVHSINMVSRLALDIYPNPSNDQTMVSFNNPEEGMVSISLFDIAGREVYPLLKNKQLNAGSHQFILNDTGLPDGVYFCELICGNLKGTQKLVVQH